MEIACLRGILKRHGLWASIADQVRHLREPETIGRAVDPADEVRLLAACGESPNPALLPAVVLSLDTGLRRSELRGLRLHDLRLEWNGDQICAGELVVVRSKTRAGEGRVVPLSRRCREALASWLKHFPGAGSSSFVFPAFRLGGGKEVRRLWGLDLNAPMGSFKRAWSKAQERAGTTYRWHDLRHTFVTRLCESPSVTEQTIRSLAGHVSTKMLERYSHIRVDAKRAAIEAVENRTGHKIGHSDGMEENAE